MGYSQSNTQNNLIAVVNPSVTDDISLGYEVGSEWFNTVTKQWYKCNDATFGAAVWNVFISVPSLPSNIGSSANKFTLVEDFIGSSNGSIIRMTNSSTSGGSRTVKNAESGHAGIITLSTGSTTAASRSQDTNQAGNSAIWFNDGIKQFDVVVKTPIAGTPSDGIELLFGFTNGVGLPPALGVIWYYNNVFYGDHFFRLIFIRGASRVTKVTSIALNGTASWRQFGVRSNAGSARQLAGTRNFEFYYRDSITPYGLVNTITEAEISAALITLPYQTTDVFNMSYAIQKQATSLVSRSMDIDTIIFNKETLDL